MGLQLPAVTQGFGAAARSGLRGCALSDPDLLPHSRAEGGDEILHVLWGGTQCSVKMVFGFGDLVLLL